MPQGRWVVRLGASALALLASLPAHAQSTAAERSYALDYEAPAKCPDAAAVRAAIESRTTGASAVEPAQAAVRFTLRLRASGDDSLWVDLPDGSFRRELHAESCEEAVASMAVIAVMVLEAAPAERRAMAEFPATDAPPAPAEKAEPPAAAAPEPAPPKTPEPQPIPERRTVAPEPDRQQKAPSPLRWAASAGVALESAVAPSPPIGFAAAVEGWWRGGWSPGLRLSLLTTATATTSSADGDAEFRLLAGRLGICPLRRALGASVLVPCATFDAGSLMAKGGGAALNTTSKSMPWLAAGASLRAQFALGPALGLEVGAGAKALLRRDRFVFRPSSLVYYVPAASFDIGASVLMQFL